MASDSEAWPARRAAATGGDPRAPSSRSLSGLDGINYLVADVQGGAGPGRSVAP